MPIESFQNNSTEQSKFLQENTVEQKKLNRENYSLFADNISKCIQYTEDILGKDSIKIKEDETNILGDGSKITYKRLHKNGSVAILDLSKNKIDFLCVIKQDPAVYESYRKNIERASDIKKYLPDVYGNINDWIVVEHINGIEDADVTEKLSTDNEFLKSYTKNIFNFLYTVAMNNFITGDVVLSEGKNVLVNPSDGTIKLTEIDNIAPYPTRGYRGSQEHFNKDELLLDNLLFEIDSLSREAKLSPDSISMRVNLLIQLFSHLLQKIDPENFKIRYRYIEYPSIPFNEFGGDGVMINPKFVNYIRNNDKEGVKDFLLKKEDITVKIPDTPENRVIVNSIDN